jgi:hypothetical protein
LILGIFQTIPSLLVLTLFGRKAFFSGFYFPGATGLEKGQGQREQLGNFEANNMKSSGLSEGQWAANETWWRGQPSRSHHQY